MECHRILNGGKQGELGMNSVRKSTVKLNLHGIIILECNQSS